jgi:hypothetical protein
MKTLLSLFVGGLLVLAMAMTGEAQDKKEVTLKGDGVCAKCGLSQTQKCQDALEVKEGDAKGVYYIKGKGAAGLHRSICQARVPLTVTGVVSTKENQKWIEASKVVK